MATFSYPLQSDRLKLTYFNKLNGSSTIANNAFFGAQANRIDIIVDIVGESITSSHGSPTVSADTNVDVVGSEITTSNGNVSAFEKFKFSKYIKTERENLSFGISKKEIKFNATNSTQIKFEKDEKQLNFDIIIKQLNFERV